MIYVQPGTVDADRPSVLWSNGLARAALSSTGGLAAWAALGNILGPQTFDWWKPAAMPAAITAIWPYLEGVDTIGIAAHNLGSSGVTVTVRYSVTPTSALVTLATFAPTDDRPILVTFPAVAASRLVFDFAGSVVPFIGILWAGVRLVIPSSIRPPYVPADSAERVEVSGLRSLGGHYLGGSILRKGVELEAVLNPVAAAWAASSLVPFRRWYDRGGTFFWAGAPSIMPEDVAYGWRPDGATELRPSLKAGGAMVDLALRVVGYA